MLGLVGAPAAQAANTASISGKVTVPAGMDVTQVRVHAWVWGPGGQGGDIVAPSPDGTYKISNLPAGSLDASADGNNRLNVIKAAAPVTVLGDGQQLMGVDFALELGAIVRGRITGGTGVDVSAATISMASDAGSNSESKRPALDGTYFFLGVRPGSTLLKVEGGGAPSTFFPSVSSSKLATRLALHPGTELTGIDVALAKGATISGRVNAPAGSTIWAGYAAARPWSDFGWESEQPYSTQIFSSGTYTIGPLWPGDYRVQAQAQFDTDHLLYEGSTQWLGSSSTPSGAAKISVAAGQDLTVTDLSIGHSGVISGTINTPSTETGSPWFRTVDALDSSGMPVASGYAGSQTSNTFRISGLAPGSYRLAFNRHSGSSLDEAQFYPDKHESDGVGSGSLITVSADQTTTVGASTLVKGGTASGSVVGPDGKALADISVNAYSDNGSLVPRSTRTDATGSFSIGGLTTGPYRIVVNADNRIQNVGTLYLGNVSDGAASETLAVTAGADTPAGVLSYAPAAPVPTLPGLAVSISPKRFLDTRWSSGRVGPGGSVSFQVAGVNGVPADASAVVLNVTVTEAQSFGFITASASGTSKPNASNVNYVAGQTVPNLAVVPVGSDGKVTLSNTSAGSVQLIADVSAFYRGGTPTLPGAFVPVALSRFLDTRTSSGKVGPGGSVSFQAAGAGGIPRNAAAVVVNVTATEPSSFGFVTAHPSGVPRPNASNVNYSAGQTVPNLVVVPVGADGKVTLSNTSAGSVQLVADVSGYFLPGSIAEAGALGSMSPVRFLDTRSSSGPVAAAGNVSVKVAGVSGVPANVAGVWVNLTVTEARSFGFLTGFASDSAKANTSNVNYVAGQTVPNMAYLPVGADGKITVSNTSSGSVQVIADVSGYVLK